MTWLIGEFRGKEELTDAIRDLRGSGYTAADLDIFSEEPVELRKGVLDRSSRMSLTAVLTAILFGSLATWFVYYAQNDYRLRSGGMPYFSFWATGVITYETTMLGAVLAIFGSFLWESGIVGSRRTKGPVPFCPPNSICLRVRCAKVRSEIADSTLRQHGAVGVTQCD